MSPCLKSSLASKLLFICTILLFTTRNLAGSVRLQGSKLFAASTKRFSSGSSNEIMAGTGCDSWKAYRLLSEDAISADWVKNLELTDAKEAIRNPHFLPHGDDGHPPRILILYGSLRTRSFSKFLAYEFARILELLGAECRVYDPRDLPPHDTEVSVTHPKVIELRELSEWSEGQVWCTPEQHGAITGLIKTQLDWIPLSVGSVRPTQGRTLAVAEVSGGSQSFNAVNTLRLLGRWMRMIVIPNQSSVPKAFTEFDEFGRMKPSDCRQRVVDCAEELFKFTLLTRQHSTFLVDRFSEREEKAAKGRLLSQAEKEAEKEALKAAAPK
jgi:arsenical resistance protein ArsH